MKKLALLAGLTAALLGSPVEAKPREPLNLEVLVVDGNDQPVNDAYVEVQDRGARNYGSSPTWEDGIASIEVSNNRGSYSGKKLSVRASMPFESNIGFDYDAKTPALSSRRLKEAGQIKVKFPRLNVPANNRQLTLNLRPLPEEDSLVGFPGQVFRGFTDIMIDGKRNSWDAQVFSIGTYVNNLTCTTEIPNDLDAKGRVVLGQITVGTRTYNTYASFVTWIGQEFEGAPTAYPVGETKVKPLKIPGTEDVAIPVLLTINENKFFYKDSY